MKHTLISWMLAALTTTAQLGVAVESADEREARMQWRHMIRMNALDIVQPDVLYVGGRAHFEAGPGWGVKVNPEWLKTAAYQISERKA